MRGPAFLFCPADRPDRYAKAAAAADSVIIDLEDAVAPDDKREARLALVAADHDPATTVVRVNAVSTDEFERDLEALAQTALTTVMLAKTEEVDQVARLGSFSVIALCESAIGVRNADRIAGSPNVIALMWGAEDLVASLGGTSSRDGTGTYRDVARFARSQVLIAAASHGKAAIDAVHLDIADVVGLEQEATDAVAVGFSGSACIHPSQVAVIRRAFAPTEQQVAWATAVLAAAEQERGVFRHDGRMVDEPVLRQARTFLRSATNGAPS